MVAKISKIKKNKKENKNSINYTIQFLFRNRRNGKEAEGKEVAIYIYIY